MDNDLFKLVTLYNPLDVPFTIRYNNEDVRTIPAGAQMPLVKMWAMAGAKHLCDALMRRDKANILDKEKRAVYMSQVWISEEGSLLGTQPTQNQLADQLIARQIASNDPVNNATNWKFDPLTGRPLQAEAVAPIPQPEMPKAPQSFSNPEVANVMSNIPQGTGERPAQDLTVEEAPVLPDKSTATKEQVLGWIRANLPVNIDEPEVATRLNAMSVEELKREYRYEELA